ncbi:unnamed protein product [Linum trigynum]|uniref:Uncharacterized protein n=1 Tax=Linum trigynum TaxID=586398 RepID=A0AAV2D0U0_9ROSI
MHRMCSFMWLVNHRKLLTNAERKCRHLIDDDGCKICGGAPETTLHILRDCPYARATWVEALQNEPGHDFFEPNIERWILHYTTGRGRTINSTLFTTMCWLLWKNRNNYCFQGKLDSCAHIQTSWVQLRLQILKASEKEQQVFGAGGLHTPTMIQWQPPQPGWSCLNTYGSVTLSTSSTAAGGVARRDDDLFVTAFSMNLGGGSINSDELAGIVHGLQITWEEGIRKVILQTNSTTALSLIDSATPHHSQYSYVAEIRRWL